MAGVAIRIRKRSASLLSLFAAIGTFLLVSLAAQAAPFAYIPNQTSNNVSVIDTATNTVVATVATGIFGFDPRGVAINPAGTRVYIEPITEQFNS